MKIDQLPPVFTSEEIKENESLRDEFIKLIASNESLLVYRSEVRDGESLEDLLNLLDIFAKTGWPDALRLVWRLDEVFR